MPTNRPAPCSLAAPGLPLSRRHAPTNIITISWVTLLILCLISTASASIITDTIVDTATDSANYEIVEEFLPSWYTGSYALIKVNKPSQFTRFALVDFGPFKTNAPNLYSNQTDIVLRSVAGDKRIAGSGRLGYYFNADRTGYVYLEVDEFNDPSSGIGGYYILANTAARPLAASYMDGLSHVEGFPVAGYISGDSPVAFSGVSGLTARDQDQRNGISFPGKYTFNVFKLFKQHIVINYSDSPKIGNADTITVMRNVDGGNYESRVIIKGKSGIYHNTTHASAGITICPSSIDRPYTIDIYSPALDREYSRTYLSGASGDDSPEAPTSSSVTVYVKNSQTGALIANSRIVIDALVNGEYYTVANRTEPSGIFSITLQPTGGGQPNPDGYRLIVTADGYNNPMPEINFTVDDYKLSIYCLLDPIAGGPVNENKTFIDFFVRDMSSNPISGATVKFGKYTLITNSAGYTVFEVDKNNNYAWTISKSGYGALTGNAVIGDAPRHTINTVLAPAVTPTKPTPIPTSPSIGPTPTMTAPTGEPVSNWLEWFAAHFGMILGGGAEIGKIFMWLCFAVPVGVYVGKESKAGAAGFMAGAGIVTLFFVLIGWVPIWLLVLLALIIGLLYAKVFNTPDNGGGR